MIDKNYIDQWLKWEAADGAAGEFLGKIHQYDFSNHNWIVCKLLKYIATIFCSVLIESWLFLAFEQSVLSFLCTLFALVFFNNWYMSKISMYMVVFFFRVVNTQEWFEYHGKTISTFICNLELWAKISMLFSISWTLTDVKVGLL